MVAAARLRAFLTARRVTTVVVTPRDAEAIELASHSGRIRLMLRSPLDSAAIKSRGLTVLSLLGRVTLGGAKTGD